MNDQKIIELIRSDKNDAALNALYKSFPLMRKIILSKGGNAHDAEDIFQEALIILVRKIKGSDFKLTAKLSTYLFSVCRFLWKDEWKKRKLPVPYDFETELSEAVEQELEEAVRMEGQWILAERALNDLKERCRELLLLFYEGRLKLKDIAVKMGYSSESTAKNQKYKCLEGAKSRLKELKQSIQSF